MPVFGDDVQEEPFATLTVEKAEALAKRLAKPKKSPVPPTFTYSINIDSGGENGGGATLGECLARAFTASLYHLRAERGRESVAITIVSQCGECKGSGQQTDKRGFMRQPCKACGGEPHTTIAAFDARLPESLKVIG